MDQAKLAQAKEELVSERAELKRMIAEFMDNKTTNDAEQNMPNPTINENYSTIIERAKNTFKPTNFGETMLDILKGRSFHPSNEYIDFLLKREFVQLISKDDGGYISYRFTEAGEDFRKQYFRSE